MTGALIGCRGGAFVLAVLLTADSPALQEAVTPELMVVALLGVAAGATAPASGLGVLAGSIGLAAMLDREPAAQ